ncbi:MULTISPECIES: DNA (cytosine-5-)-methyltransferase [Bacteroidaceae]|jgi:DNA (cytosine-5)-methyltransferase 1|uniref:DNA (cytosine-5-)-methyltransferase n=3 Tax=Phocaeicola plebeius TaxID=310297 RepID=A0A414FWM4_9BACT|nr:MULTISPECIES: DNA (cytosine-5-)-methyltransferase [Bacteroidaceae]MCI6051314.1 DNA (cytosine-5-)-methyltransferase [Phocaeicola plebeius]MDD6912658.1 DNA (cytosine-5-)-methyltransferase [Phocaeicola plebeius]MDY5977546.1 DNA (cytosine-5-)-methyltransferase [Phocaeicola plebeius]RHD55781.1 DNA (cytosine-5-)-methyltransferase [Phocaeicola plebeius]
MANFSFIDLFAGIGGFRLALQSVGGTCIGFSEIAPDAINTYCQNFKEDTSANFGDITKLKTLPEHDFMTAGVPCQSWSIAGKNLGFDDDRGQLWNDTLYLLNKVRPKAFIFENVKGLADPRNAKALEYILNRIKQAGYYSKVNVLNAYDYGVPQTRIRIYIIGFKEKKYLDKFALAPATPGCIQLSDVLDDCEAKECRQSNDNNARWSLSCNEKGFNDYFLFNDLRNGSTTIHSWDIQETTDREKNICYLLLKNRRKDKYGELDGNPLNIKHFQELDSSIKESDLEVLVEKGILKRVSYLYKVREVSNDLSDDAKWVLNQAKNGIINFDTLKSSKELKKRKINALDTLFMLETIGAVKCIEERYDFKNTKISTGLAGINRIFLPTCKIYPTLVASDTNDYVTTENLNADNIEDFRAKFMESVYRAGNYRQISKQEACRIQGFPANFLLPPTRARWMKLIGNSVAVPVIKMLANAIVNTGVFEGQENITVKRKHKAIQLDLLSLFEEYGEHPITENFIVHDNNDTSYDKMMSKRNIIKEDKNVLISLVKKDNEKAFLDKSAKVYYTGKKFPTTVALNKLFYFMPYIKGKGVKDLWLIKVARLGFRKEGTPLEDKNDLRLVFEIEYVSPIFDDYQSVELKIWRTFTDSTIYELLKTNKKKN